MASPYFCKSTYFSNEDKEISNFLSEKTSFPLFLIEKNYKNITLLSARLYSSLYNSAK